MNKLISLFLRLFFSPQVYARYIGVQIGENCLINTRNWSSEPYLIKIGSNVQVTSNVYFHTHGGANVVRKKYPDFDVFGKIIVEDWAYIGANSQIMPGVTIGEGALVAAGSIVTKSVEPYTVVGGNPARYICSVEDFIKKNIAFNLNSKGLSAKEKKELLLSLDDDKFLRK
jgi:acetyltransferase-like isoleucine patch superfamily enzyme